MGKHGVYATQEYLGMKKGHLTVLGYEAGRFICQCDCGNRKKVIPIRFLDNKIKTCGYECTYHNHIDEKPHGKPIYFVWKHTIYRCKKSNHLTMCQEWANSFHTFYNWAINNGYQSGLRIKRIDRTKGYSPDNCTWAKTGAAHDPITAP